MADSQPVRTREIVAWAMFDFANSGYTTVVLTAIFNAYFVSVIAGQLVDNGDAATLLWTITTSTAYLLVLLSAPIIGAIADYGAHKKTLSDYYDTCLYWFHGVACHSR